MFNYQNFNLKINLYLKDISNVGGRQSQIWLSTTINGERIRLYTKILVNKEHWIPSNRSAVNDGGYIREDNTLDRVTLRENKKKNKAIKQILSYCEDYVQLVCNNSLLASATNTLEYSVATFKDYMSTRINGQDYMQRMQFIPFVENYIEHKKREVNSHTGRIVSVGTIYNHTNALRRLRKFAQEKHITLSWNTFTKDFEHEFTAWMNEQEFTPNTIASEYSIIKVWLAYAEERGLITHKAFHHYKTATHDVPNIYLTEEEIKRIYELDLTELIQNGQSQIEETRDLFVVGCWTGLRYSDYSHLPEIHDTDETIIIRTQKTDTEVTIPLHSYVKAIYQKYNGKLPRPIDKGKALKHIQIIARNAGITSPIVLTKIKGGKRIDISGEKCDFIVNHTARRSFASNMYIKKVPTASIMKITGHTTEENFMKYIKLDAREHVKIVAQAFKQHDEAS